MSSPTVKDLNYTYKKSDSDVWVLNTKDIPVDKKLIKDIQIAHLAPNSFGGNHKHPRTEWFIGIGDLEFVWLDGNGKKYSCLMNPNGKLKLVTVPSFTPHAVINKSKTKEGIIYEMADAEAKDFTKVNVV